MVVTALGLKAAGGVLLVACGVWIGGLPRRRCSVQLQTVRAWEAVLDVAHHRIADAGMDAEQLLSLCLADGRQSALLGGGELLLDVTAQGAQAALEALCVGAAATLPAHHTATEALRSLSQTLGDALRRQEASEAVVRLREQLKHLEHELEHSLAGECRVLPALAVCGALCALLMLW